MFLPSNITLQFGDSGDFVHELQRRLAGIDAHPHDALNGFYDGVTVNSVSQFQSRVGIRADGIAGPETLRRLNGVVSGDATTSDKKEEEEKQLAAEQHLRDQMILNQLEANAQVPMMAQQAVEAVEVAAIAEAALHHPAHASAIDPQQQIQHQLQHDIAQQLQNQQHQAQQHQPQHQPQQQHVSHDMLAQMLQQQTQQPQQQATPHQAQHHQPAAPQHTHTQHQQPAMPTQMPAAPHPQPQQHQAVAAPTAAAHTVPAVAGQEPAAEQKGLVGRAMQKMDGFVQRLAEQFESKLPPHVIEQVKQLGQIMMRSGVQEASIPTGPEMARGPQAPARGPEQQQAAHRG